MNKLRTIISIIMLCVVYTTTFAYRGLRPNAELGVVGVKHFDKVSGYKAEYLGKSVYYVPQRKVSTSQDRYYDYNFSGDNHFERKGGVFYKPYKITKVSGNDKKVKFQLTDPDTQEKLDFEFINKITYNDDFCSYTNHTAGRLPLVVVDYMDKLKLDNFGKEYPQNAPLYRVVGAEVKYEYGVDRYPQPLLVVQNLMTGKESLWNANRLPRILKELDDNMQYVNRTFGVDPNNPRYKVVGLKFIILSYEDSPAHVYYEIIDNTTDRICTIELDQFDIFDLIGQNLTNPETLSSYTIIGVPLRQEYDDFVLMDNITGDIIIPKEDALDKKFSINKRLGKITTKLFKEDLSSSYKGYLSKVEKPKNANIRKGKIKSNDDKVNSYTDNVIDIEFTLMLDRLNLSLKNLTQATIKILWDNAAFVDYDNTSSRVIHKDIKYSDMQSVQTPTIVVKGSRVEDLIIPVSRIQQKKEDWTVDPLIPTNKSNGDFRIVLPIEIDGIVNEYLFEFSLKYTFNHPERVKAQK